MNERSPWHFSHLGKGYFTVIIHGAKGAGFWPLTFIYTGKSGKVPYADKAIGRMVNPKWMVEDAHGDTRTVDGGMAKPDAYNRRNLIRWEYAQIAEYFKLDL